MLRFSNPDNLAYWLEHRNTPLLAAGIVADNNPQYQNEVLYVVDYAPQLQHGVLYIANYSSQHKNGVLKDARTSYRYFYLSTKP